MGKEWFKDWFASDDYLEVYKHRDNADADQLLDLVQSNINLNQNANILDAACGAGRHSIKLAKKGFKLTAFDLSETLLKIAKEESAIQNLNIDFINSDLRYFSINKKFDLVLSLFTSFGYFENDEENFAFVNNAYNLLNNNGFYVLDFLNSEYVKSNLIPSSVKEFDGREVFEKRSISDGRVIKEIKIKSASGEQNFIESVMLYDYYSITSNFKKIGFKKIKTFGDYLGNEFDNINSSRCIIFFQK